ncbi:MAG: ATP-binding protein [Candidatus Marinimicrobia bacterium]|nr:ATP-binding protein [Candidatus Neomarinimicrobiota bacterium]
MKRQPDLSQLLLSLGALIVNHRNDEKDSALPKSFYKGEEYRSLIIAFKRSDVIKSFKFKHNDILLIAAAWYKYIVNRERTFDPLELLRTVFGGQTDIVVGLDQIIRLAKQNVFYTMKKIIANLPFNITHANSPPIEIAKHSLLENEICIHRTFTKLLLNEQYQVSSNLDEPYKSNKEFLTDWFAYVNMLYEFSIWGFESRKLGEEMEEGPVNEYLKAMDWKNQIDAKLQLTEEIFPLIDVVEEYGLDENEKTILMLLVKADMDGDSSIDMDDAIKIISTNHHEMYQHRAYLSVDSKLVRHGLVEVADNVFFRTKGSDIRVSPDITRRIVMKTPVNDDERLIQILKGNDLFTLLSPNQTFDDLILHNEMKTTIHTGISQYLNNTDRLLREWGLYEGSMEVLGAYKKKLEPGLLMLFYGPAGTGKTFAAGAVANLLGKKLLVTDISRIQSKWVGDSEKNVKRLFSVYEKAVRRTSNPPVLLLNEADQFLTRRLDTTDNAVDVMYNSLQNLFLEAFEQLRGILIATTNLKTNLDTAFSRRFHLKLEFPLPDINERQALWKLHLPTTIPGASTIDINSLATDYNITGGQIQIIVKNAATEAASRTNSKRKLTQQDLIKYCQLEMVSTFDKNRLAIGFRA